MRLNGLGMMWLPSGKVPSSSRAGVTVFSLPSFGSETVRRHIELGVRGTPELAAAAFAAMRAELERRGCELGDK